MDETRKDFTEVTSETIVTEQGIEYIKFKPLKVKFGDIIKENEPMAEKLKRQEA